MSTPVSTTGGCTFEYTSLRSRCRRVSARARSQILFSSVDLRHPGRGFERLDHLLGCERLVRRAWRIRVAAMGMVGSGARTRSTTEPLAISLAGAVCLFSRHRRISLHGFDARALDRVAGLPRRSLARRRVDQVRHGEFVRWRTISRNEKFDARLADARRCRARLWIVCASLAGDFGLCPGLRARIAAG